MRGSANVDGDDQKALDIMADEMIHIALSEVKAVASYLSEEQDAAVQIHDDGKVIVASDPLMGHRILTRMCRLEQYFQFALLVALCKLAVIKSPLGFLFMARKPLC